MCVFVCVCVCVVGWLVEGVGVSDGVSVGEPAGMLCVQVKGS